MLNDSGIIIQARTGSTRYPEKVIAPFFNNESILEILISRLKKLNIPTVVATTTSNDDKPIIAIAARNKIPSFQGSENNVLDRFVKAGEKYSFKNIIRVCADNPFLDTTSINALLKIKNDYDYVSFCLSDDTPVIKSHYGLWPEIVSLKALKKVQELTEVSVYQEHVTNFIYENPDLFKLNFLRIPDYLEKLKYVRLTLDTANDFNLLKKLYKNTVNNSNTVDAKKITLFLKKHKEYLHLMQKEIAKNKK